MANTFPGLIVRDAPRTQRPTTPVGTSVGAFVGVAEKGEINKATFCTSWGDFVRNFGGFINDGYLAYAVRAFFSRGGSSCWVTRVESSTAPALRATTSFQDGSSASLTVSGKTPGSWANNLSVEVVSRASSFDLIVRENGQEVERFENLTDENAEGIVNEQSNYIEIEIEENTNPDSGTSFLTGGSNGIADISDSDYIGDESDRSGLYSFDAVDINLLAIPGVATVGVHNALINYASQRGTVYAVLDCPLGETPTSVKSYRDSINATDVAQILYPWIEVPDPIGTNKLIPPSGEVMGIIASTDAAVGVWRAPAGTDYGSVNAIRTEYQVTDAEQGLLNPAGVNVIRSFPGEGLVLWGNRNLDGSMVNHTRLRLYIKDYFKRNFNWVVFQPIDDTLMGPTGTVAVNGNSFMGDLYQQGAFDGDGGADSFFVQCDRDNNTPESIAQNKLYIRVGYRHKGVAEFVIVDVGLAP